MKNIDVLIEEYLGEAASKCSVCGKKVKENTHGDNKYCQGHDTWGKKSTGKCDK